MAILLDRDESLVDGAVTRARAILTELGAVPFLARLEAAVRGPVVA